MTIEITAPTIHEAAFNSLQAHITEGRLAQGTWGRVKDGKNVACLLGAAAGITDAGDCPAALMPPWLAHLTPVLFDGLPKAAVTPTASRYAYCMRYWGKITADGWERILARYLIRAIDQAVDAVPASAKTASYWPAIAEAVEACKEVVLADAAAAAAARAADAARAAYAVTAAAAAYAVTAAAAYESLFAALLTEIEAELRNASK